MIHKKIKRFVALLWLLSFAYLPNVQAMPSLIFQPSLLSFNTGDTVDVSVSATGLGSDIVSAFDIWASFNPAILDGVGVAFTNNLNGGGVLGSLQDFKLIAGSTELAEISLLSDSDLALAQASLLGTVPLGMLEFTALQAGDTSTLAFSSIDVKGLNNLEIITNVPEPSTAFLLGAGLLGLALLREWAKKAGKV